MHKKPDLYTRHMRHGMRLHRKGEHLDATEEFLKALSSAQDDEQRTTAAQALGIDFRLAGWFDDAEVAFEQALEYGRGSMLTGKTLREYALLKLDQRKLAEARKMLQQALMEKPCTESPLEFAVTWGFFGSFFRLDGQRATALAHYASAYQDIHKQHDIYELNHLIWWLKALGPIGRVRRLPRTVWLAVTTRHPQRLKEVVLIALVGAHLVDRIKRRRQGR